MNRMTEIEARGLEPRAALLERQANDREAETPMLHRSVSGYYDSLERITRYRQQARDLRAQAERLRQETS
ncbi:hypothetical protein [Brevibacterium zhoupengii]|uniref:hypothetical protein n=1 Tax=Brevibacterium zhoupengii TaxID=2898795 RepID=UPI001F0928C2|nr:hypothetical protein [Brevibacterium zhoupengii]